MLMWKCDVCTKTGESPTSLEHLRLMPKGWRFRGDFGIEIHCCSAACAKKYDLAEAEQIGFSWHLPDDETVTSAGRPIRPLKVK